MQMCAGDRGDRSALKAMGRGRERFNHTAWLVVNKENAKYFEHTTKVSISMQLLYFISALTFIISFRFVDL